MNGGVDKSKGEGESDEGSSKDGDGVSGSDGASKVKRRRGELCRNCYFDCVYFGYYCMVWKSIERTGS